MAENSHQMNSKNYVDIRGLRGSWPLHIIHSRMRLQKGRIEWLWKQQGKCFMINIFLCIYGKKYLEQRCMHRTILHIKYSRTRHLKKYFPTRSHNSAILEYSVVQYTHTFQKKEDKVRSFRKEGYICGILWKLEGLQNILPRVQEDWH